MFMNSFERSVPVIYVVFPCPRSKYTMFMEYTFFYLRVGFSFCDVFGNSL